MSPAERRGSERQDEDLPALIIVGERAVACRTVNLSDHGAKLHVPGIRVLPGAFVLRIPSRRLDRPARLVWRTGEHVGVSFG